MAEDLALPSERELELETLLRQRDKHIASLTDEISTLRRQLPGTSDPADDSAISIPPTILALLAPLVAHGPSTSTSAPLDTVIIQRLKLLQAENDELYELLRASESARAKEELVGLRKTVKHLESSLEDAEARISELTSRVGQARPSVKSINNVQQHQSRRSSTPDQRRSASPPRRSGPNQSRLRDRSKDRDSDNDRQRDRDRDRGDRDRRDWDRDRDRAGGNPPTGPRSHKKPRVAGLNVSSENGPGRKPDGGSGNRNVSDSGRNGNDRSRNGGGVSRSGSGAPRSTSGSGGMPVRGPPAAGPNGHAGDRGLVNRLGL